MNTLMIIKNIKKRTIVPLYYKSENEAIESWNSISLTNEWETVYLKERDPGGHRYQVTCTKQDEQGNIYTKYIICFSKKEALYLENKIKEINQNYIIQIEKLY